MFWRKLTPAEYKVLTALPYALTCSDVAKKAMLSPSYVNSKVKKICKEAWIRFLVDYRALGLSPMYLIVHYDREADKILSNYEIPYIKRVIKIWDLRGSKILIEACPPSGLEKNFAYMLPFNLTDVWVKEWEVKYLPRDGDLTRFTGSGLSVEWANLPSILGKTKLLWSTSKPAKVDKVDLFIVREKERFVFSSLSEMAKKLGLSQQLLSYHYRVHVRPLWRGNCIEPKVTNVPVIYRVETASPGTALSLLWCFSQIPWLIDGFALQGNEKTIFLVLEASLEDIMRMHSSLLQLDGVVHCELLAFMEAESEVYHGLTAHLGLEEEGWSLKPVEKVLEKLGGLPV